MTHIDTSEASQTEPERETERERARVRKMAPLGHSFVILVNE